MSKLEKIKELSTWDMGDTVHTYSGYDRVEMPEPTAKNMKLFMEKINELDSSYTNMVSRNNISKSNIINRSTCCIYSI